LAAGENFVHAFERGFWGLWGFVGHQMPRLALLYCLVVVGFLGIAIRGIAICGGSAEGWGVPWVSVGDQGFA
jgi:hypothetical protein